MNLSAPDLKNLSQIAEIAAKEAGEYIRSRFDTENKTQYKKAGQSFASQVFTEVDIKSQEIILNHLAPTQKQYNLGMLTEEAIDDNSRLTKEYFWCIDPLDGSLPFIEKKDGFAVSIALVSKAGIPVIGVILDPVEQNMYSAIQGQGVFKNNKQWNILQENKSGTPLTLICDRSFLEHPNFHKFEEGFRSISAKQPYNGLQLIKHGGAVMNAIWVLENTPACYFKLPKESLGGGSLWDFAATACIYKELQLTAQQVNGKALDLNPKHTTFMNEQGIIYTSEIKLLEAIKALI